MMMMGQGRLIAPEASSICVLYDPADGRILHMHRVTTLPGGRKMDTKEVEARTFELAKRCGVDVSRAHALHVDPRDVKPSVPHRVDVRTRRLVVRPGGIPSKWGRG